MKIYNTKVNWSACEVILLLFLLTVRCVRSFQNKDLLDIFLFLSNSCRKTGNMRTRTKIVNPCITFFVSRKNEILFFLTRDSIFVATWSSWHIISPWHNILNNVHNKNLVFHDKQFCVEKKFWCCAKGNLVSTKTK